MLRRAITVLCTLPSLAVAADYALQMGETGFREYYCQNTVTLRNQTDTTLTEINGFFLIFDENGTQVGRSRGASFTNVAPGGSTAVTFESPNAPCDTALDFRFVIGACRIDAGFSDKSVCAEALDFAAPITGVFAP